MPAQTQKELEIARDWNGGDRKSIHEALAKEKEEYEFRPKAPNGSVLSTIAKAPKMKNGGHTKTSLLRFDRGHVENSRALHEGGKVRKATTGE